jgi:molybdopterin synthase sulfur carrier subunit
MKITLRTFADIREIVGTKEQELSLPEGVTVGALLGFLCEAHPALREKLFDPAGKLKPYMIILKNGRNITSLQQLDTAIDGGDVIAVFPPVAGG